jgi:hypothetical protein
MYDKIVVCGRVTSHQTLEGADAHVDKLEKKHHDKDKQPWRALGEVRHAGDRITHVSTWYDNNSDGFQETKASVSFVRIEHRSLTCPIGRARPESKAGTASSLYKGKTLPQQTLVSP